MDEKTDELAAHARSTDVAGAEEQARGAAGTGTSAGAAGRRGSLRLTVGLWVGLAAVLAAIGIVAKVAFDPSQAAAIAAPGASVGTQLDGGVPAAILNLPLEDQNGRPVSLAAFRGKTLMISDTMTLCQETCPLDTEDLVQTARAMDADGLGANVEFLTITIDPTRDTPTQLAAYRDLYSPVPSNWQTLTGSPAAIAQLWKYFGVYIQKVPEGDPPAVNWRTGQKLTYDLNHSDEIYFIDAKGDERFLLEGMGHVAPGTTLPPAMQKYLDAQGQLNLSASASDGWTVPQALQTMSWLLQKPVAQPGQG
jgi:protein SCO1/2